MIIDLSKYKLVPDGGRFSYFYPHYAICHEYFHKDHPWAQQIGMIGISKNHFVRWFTLVHSNKDFDVYLNRFIKNSFKLEKYIKTIKKETVKKLRIKLNIPNKEIAKLAAYYYYQYENILLAAGNLRVIDKALILKLRKIFKNMSNPDEIISLFSISKKPSFAMQEEIALLKIAKEIVDKKITANQIKKKIQKIHKKFCRLTCGYYDESSKTINDYNAKLKELVRLNPKKKFSEIITKRKEDLRIKKKVMLNLKKNELYLVTLASYSAYLKDLFKFSINEITYYAEPMFKEIAKRTKKPVAFLKDLLPEEVSRLLQGDDINKKEVIERTQYNMVITFPGKCTIFTGDDAKDFDKKYLHFKLEESEFKGRVAFPGCVKGYVKIVLGSSDFNRLKKRDVLVAMNTSPDYIPIIKKSAAIVAEEGGLTSHVSVVSREFRIPCIVGIANITKILKDNDYVEVDANKGVVKIIKRKK